MVDVRCPANEQRLVETALQSRVSERCRHVSTDPSPHAVTLPHVRPNTRLGQRQLRDLEGQRRGDHRARGTERRASIVHELSNPQVDEVARPRRVRKQRVLSSAPMTHHKGRTTTMRRTLHGGETCPWAPDHKAPDHKAPEHKAAVSQCDGGVSMSRCLNVSMSQCGNAPGDGSAPLALRRPGAWRRHDDERGRPSPRNDTGRRRRPHRRRGSRGPGTDGHMADRFGSGGARSPVSAPTSTVLAQPEEVQSRAGPPGRFRRAAWGRRRSLVARSATHAHGEGGRPRRHRRGHRPPPGCRPVPAVGPVLTASWTSGGGQRPSWTGATGGVAPMDRGGFP